MPPRASLLAAIRLATTVLAGLALAAPTPVRAEDGAAADAFRRAELAERSLGDLGRAADLYRESARNAADAESRAVAEVRAAHCLRRLGRIEEARALATPLAEENAAVPPEVRRAAEGVLRDLAATVPGGRTTPTSASDASAKDHELDREETSRALEAAIERATRGYETEIERLVQRLRESNAENERMRRESEAAADPRTPEEVIELRRRDLERRRAQDEKVARAFVKTARLLHREGRFTEARACLNDALQLVPEDAEARALLDRVSPPLGEREALFQKTLEVLALAREVRAARRAAEVANLVEEGRRRQTRGDWLGSSAPLEQALALLDADDTRAEDGHGDESRAGPGAREAVLGLLQAAAARGVARAPVAVPDAGAEPEPWIAALRELLTGAGSEVARGLEMRFHDLGPVVFGASLPPVPIGRAPEGWTLTVRGPDPSPLLAARLRTDEARALAAPGASLRTVGGTLVALADRETQRRLTVGLAGLRIAAPPATEVRVQTWRIDASSVAALLARRGVAQVPAEGEALAAVLAPGDVQALVESAAASPSLGAAAFRATSLRAFRISASNGGTALMLDVLPAAGASPGLGVRVETSAASDRSAPGRLRTTCITGGSCVPGGGVLVYGLADPGIPGRDVAVLVRIGEAGAVPQPTALAPEVRDASELLLAAHLAAVADPPASTDLLPDRPWPSRRDALLRRLRERVRDATLLDFRDDRVLVAGPPTARRAAETFLSQLAAVRLPQSFEVRVHHVPAAVEERVLASAPRLSPATSGAFAWCVLRGEAERRPIELLVAAAKGEVPFLDPVVAAPPTGRCDATRVLRSLYRSGPGVAPPGVPGFGRGETAWVEEGLQISIRPFGRTPDGRTDLDLGARARWVSDRGQRDAETVDGSVRVLEPAVSSWAGDVSTTLARGDALLLARARSPFAAGDSDRLVVLVRPLE